MSKPIGYTFIVEDPAEDSSTFRKATFCAHCYESGEWARSLAPERPIEAASWILPSDLNEHAPDCEGCGDPLGYKEAAAEHAWMAKTVREQRISRAADPTYVHPLNPCRHE